MYQGPVDSLVPYLQTMNLDCPNHHSPTDFGKISFFVMENCLEKIPK